MITYEIREAQPKSPDFRSFGFMHDALSRYFIATTILDGPKR